jgi:hypothetical protein
LIIRKLLIYLLFPLLASAQGPGYIGKKMLAGYGVKAGPSLNGSAAKGFNFSQEAFFEGISGMHTSFGLSLSYSPSWFNNSVAIDKLGIPQSGFYIHSFSFAPYVKKFGRSYIAPWGKYWMFGPVIGIAASRHNSYMYATQTLADHDSLLMDFGPATQLHATLDLMIGKGRTRVFKDKILLDYGFNLQVISLISSINGPDYSDISTKDYIRRVSVARLQDINGLNLYLRVAYLF